MTTKAENNILSLKEQILDIQNNGELGFRCFILCERIISYGQYVPTMSNRVKVGKELKFYYEPLNLFTNRKDGVYQIWFTQDMILRNSEGRELMKNQKALNFNYQTVAPVLDVYATNSLELGELPPGDYKYEAIIHDVLRDARASTTYAFSIIK